MKVKRKISKKASPFDDIFIDCAVFIKNETDKAYLITLVDKFSEFEETPAVTTWFPKKGVVEINEGIEGNIIIKGWLFDIKEELHQFPAWPLQRRF